MLCTADTRQHKGCRVNNLCVRPLEVASLVGTVKCRGCTVNAHCKRSSRLQVQQAQQNAEAAQWHAYCKRDLRSSESSCLLQGKPGWHCKPANSSSCMTTRLPTSLMYILHRLYQPADFCGVLWLTRTLILHHDNTTDLHTFVREDSLTCFASCWL